MAQGIVDCTGKTINIGDKVLTESGDVIEVCGGLVSEHVLFNAETCKVVPSSTPLTNTGHVKEFKAKKDQKKSLFGAPTALAAAEGDCVVWGT